MINNLFVIKVEYITAGDLDILADAMSRRYLSSYSKISFKQIIQGIPSDEIMKQITSKIGSSLRSLLRVLFN